MIKASVRPAEARGGRLRVPLLFCLALLGLNWGLASLAPAQPVVTQLPFAMTSLTGWTSVSGDWVWQGGLEQLSKARALLRSPLELSANNVRLHAQLADNAGISFLMQHPKSTNESHVAYVLQGRLGVGYLNAAGAFESDFSYALPENATLSLQLDGDSYAVLINHDVVARDLPLRHRDGLLGLFAQAETQISGLLVEAGTPVTDAISMLEEMP